MNDNACDYTIQGNPEGPTLFFIHGWPDDPSLWRKQVAALERTYRCVLVTLPNFGESTIVSGGVDFPELVQMLARTLNELQLGDSKVTLITHDWGAYIGYMLEQAYPKRFSKIIGMDVGRDFAPKFPIEALLILSYQWSLIACWLVGGIWPFLSNCLSRCIGAFIGVPHRQRKRICSRSNYPYFYYWRDTLLPWKRKGLLKHYRPSCPVLYLYGKAKPVMFHSDRWLSIVEQSGGRWEGIDGAGHWFMETHPVLVNDSVQTWLQLG